MTPTVTAGRGPVGRAGVICGGRGGHVRGRDDGQRGPVQRHHRGARPTCRPGSDHGPHADGGRQPIELCVPRRAVGHGSAGPAGVRLPASHRGRVARRGGLRQGGPAPPESLLEGAGEDDSLPLDPHQRADRHPGARGQTAAAETDTPARERPDAPPPARAGDGAATERLTAHASGHRPAERHRQRPWRPAGRPVRTRRRSPPTGRCCRGRCCPGGCLALLAALVALAVLLRASSGIALFRPADPLDGPERGQQAADRQRHHAGVDHGGTKSGGSTGGSSGGSGQTGAETRSGSVPARGVGGGVYRGRCRRDRSTRAQQATGNGTIVVFNVPDGRIAPDHRPPGGELRRGASGTWPWPATARP